MKNITFIGDLHGQYGKQYSDFVLNATNQSIQIGDFGLEKYHTEYAKYSSITHSNHKILFGNHDWYPNLNYAYSLGNYGYLPELNAFYVRGAFSVDYKLRYSGIDWFSNEELSYSELYDCLDLYESIKPDVIISHDCPTIVRNAKYGIYDYTQTSVALQQMFDIHKPKLWIYGHHHISDKFNLSNVEFKALGINEYWSISL